MKFVITSMDASTDHKLYELSISVDLIDETQGNKILATFSIGLLVDSTKTATEIKNYIAQETAVQLQAQYNAWKVKQAAVNDFLVSNQTALENYLNTNVVL